jgi:hypothetical protein
MLRLAIEIRLLKQSDLYVNSRVMTVAVLLLDSIYEFCHVELSLVIPILISHRRISNRIASLTVVHPISRCCFICNP